MIQFRVECRCILPRDITTSWNGNFDSIGTDLARIIGLSCKHTVWQTPDREHCRAKQNSPQTCGVQALAKAASGGTARALDICSLRTSSGGACSIGPHRHIEWRKPHAIGVTRTPSDRSAADCSRGSVLKSIVRNVDRQLCADVDWFER